MKITDLAKRYDKMTVYDSFCHIMGWEPDYELITRREMLEAIIEQFNTENYLCELCTADELDFLKQSLSKTKKPRQFYQEFHCEVHELVKKLVIDSSDYQIFDELIPILENTLAYVELAQKQRRDKIIIFMIGFLRTVADFPKDDLIAFAGDAFHAPTEEIASLTNTPLFRFYVSCYRAPRESMPTFTYRDYYDDKSLHADIEQLRKKYIIADGARRICIDDYLEIFYYGMPMRKVAFRRFYDIVMNIQPPYRDMLLRQFDESRLLYKKDLLESSLSFFEYLMPPDIYQEFRKDALKAWEEMPSAVLGGLSPKEYRKVAKDYESLKTEFPLEKQKDAHLSKVDTDYFYEIYFALLEHTNKIYQLNPHRKRFYRQPHPRIQEISKIEAYFWSHKERCIDRFIKDNPFDFGDESLETIRGFRSAITSDTFVIVGFEKSYTKIYDAARHCIYMIKGVRDNFDTLKPQIHIPTPISTTLLNFKGHIIYRSTLGMTNLDLGVSWKKQLLEEMKGAETYYILPDGNDE